MMNNIHYAMVMSSVEYKSLIHSVLRQNDIMFQEAMASTANDKNVLNYIKQFASKMTDYDSVIIDLGCTVNTDEEIMEAIESIRYIDDRIRIIVLQGVRHNGYGILHQCFLSGIYNLLRTSDYVHTKEALLYCVTIGMSYKDALEFREAIPEKNRQVNTEAVQSAKKIILISGMGSKIGTTHCSLLTAYSLRKQGYLVAVYDCTGSSDYLSLMQSYEQSGTEDGYFSLESIDFFIKSSLDDLHMEEQPYNFIIIDVGSYHRIQSLSENEKNICNSADEKILVAGAKPWELPALSQTISNMQDTANQYKYLFNFIPSSMEKDVKDMMESAGISAANVFFLENLPDYFSKSLSIIQMLGFQQEKKKRGFFKKKGE